MRFCLYSEIQRYKALSTGILHLDACTEDAAGCAYIRAPILFEASCIVRSAEKGFDREQPETPKMGVFKN